MGGAEGLSSELKGLHFQELRARCQGSLAFWKFKQEGGGKRAVLRGKPAVEAAWEEIGRIKGQPTLEQLDPIVPFSWCLGDNAKKELMGKVRAAYQSIGVKSGKASAGGKAASSSSSSSAAAASGSAATASGSSFVMQFFG